MKTSRKLKSKFILIAHLLFVTASLLMGIFSRQVQARECYFTNVNTAIINAGTLTVSSFSPSNTTPTLLGTVSGGKVADVNCDNGNDGSDWYGWALNTQGVQSDSYTTNAYTYNRGFWPTTIPGIYYAVYIKASDYKNVYLPSSTAVTRLLDYAWDPMHYNAYLTIEIWQRGTVSAVGDAHPAISGELGRFRAGSASNTDQQIPVLLNNSSFTVRFATPTCNLSVSPTTIDFGDVGNEKPRVNFTLKNSNCINASSVTLKLTSTKAIYDNSNLSILANTTTGTSAAGGRGVAISWEDSSRKYLSANDSNSSVTINFGSIVSSKDIPMAALLTCTSASNNSTCDNYTPGAFTASGVISATYK
ncbi:pilus assembly protein FimA [Citrobacter freundii]|uniref:pilus assembly protein FimA n=1 Tax=Citrobacter freundii TaxID=546 RepID=UPI0015EA64D3|nr:pilus assembly protein FimA [Citrobacter freundii]QMD25286.1 pilus assembly protein FimA [Citrobacter freundii]